MVVLSSRIGVFEGISGILILDELAVLYELCRQVSLTW